VILRLTSIDKEHSEDFGTLIYDETLMKEKANK